MSSYATDGPPTLIARLTLDDKNLKIQSTPPLSPSTLGGKPMILADTSAAVELVESMKCRLSVESRITGRFTPNSEDNARGVVPAPPDLKYPRYSVSPSATATPIMRSEWKLPAIELSSTRPVVLPLLVLSSTATPVMDSVSTSTRCDPLPALDGARTMRIPPVVMTVLLETTWPT